MSTPAYSQIRAALQYLQAAKGLPSLKHADLPKLDEAIKLLASLLTDAEMDEVLDRARETVRPVIEREKANENLGSVMDLRLDAAKPVPPVDRSARVLLSGKKESEMPDYRETEPRTGMQKDYVVLSPEERAKGFVRPVRRSYKHLTCGAVTTMGIALAETYARDPSFYSGTMCVNCHAHFPLSEFVWEGANEVLGS